MDILNITQSKPQSQAMCNVDNFELGGNEFPPVPQIQTAISIEFFGSENESECDYPQEISDGGRFTNLMEPHFLTGVVMFGLQESRRLGFPTANLNLARDVVVKCAMALKDGSYCCFVKNECEQIFLGVALWRNSNRQMSHFFEVHLIDAPDVEFYGDLLMVVLCGYMRPLWSCRPFKKAVARQHFNEDIAHAQKMLGNPEATAMKTALRDYHPNTSGLNILTEGDGFCSLGLSLCPSSPMYLAARTPFLVNDSSFSAASSCCSILPSVHASSEYYPDNLITDDEIALCLEELFEAFQTVSKGRAERNILNLCIEFAYTCSNCADKSFCLYYCDVHETYECFSCWQKECCDRSVGCASCMRTCPRCNKKQCSNCFKTTEETCDICTLQL